MVSAIRRCGATANKHRESPIFQIELSFVQSTYQSCLGVISKITSRYDSLGTSRCLDIIDAGVQTGHLRAHATHHVKNVCRDVKTYSSDLSIPKFCFSPVPPRARLKLYSWATYPLHQIPVYRTRKERIRLPYCSPSRHFQRHPYPTILPCLRSCCGI
jgi:hypothetical protein